MFSSSHYQSNAVVALPILTKGSGIRGDNYRPISHTSIACKILAAVSKNSLLDYFVRSHLVNLQRPGFLPSGSCLTKVLETLQEWITTIDGRQMPSRRPVVAASTHPRIRSSFQGISHRHFEFLSIVNNFGHAFTSSCLRMIVKFRESCSPYPTRHYFRKTCLEHETSLTLGNLY